MTVFRGSGEANGRLHETHQPVCPVKVQTTIIPRANRTDEDSTSEEDMTVAQNFIISAVKTILPHVHSITAELLNAYISDLNKNEAETRTEALIKSRATATIAEATATAIKKEDIITPTNRTNSKPLLLPTHLHSIPTALRPKRESSWAPNPTNWVMPYLRRVGSPAPTQETCDHYTSFPLPTDNLFQSTTASTPPPDCNLATTNQFVASASPNPRTEPIHLVADYLRSLPPTLQSYHRLKDKPMELIRIPFRFDTLRTPKSIPKYLPSPPPPTKMTWIRTREKRKARWQKK